MFCSISGVNGWIDVAGGGRSSGLCSMRLVEGGEVRRVEKTCPDFFVLTAQSYTVISRSRPR